MSVNLCLASFDEFDAYRAFGVTKSPQSRQNMMQTKKKSQVQEIQVDESTDITRNDVLAKKVERAVRDEVNTLFVAKDHDHYPILDEPCVAASVVFGINKSSNSISRRRRITRSFGQASSKMSV